MIDAFPLDYMHLVCLGVMRKLMTYWRSHPVTVHNIRRNLSTRLRSTQFQAICNNLCILTSQVPCEFSRKPRSLMEADRWKATEWRQFLLYTGPVVLKGIIPDVIYNHFLLLHSAIRILTGNEGHLYQFASELLNAFVKDAIEIYGTSFAVYNVHGLTHLARDAMLHGKLDNFSAFPFENYLGMLKTCL